MTNMDYITKFANIFKDINTHSVYKRLNYKNEFELFLKSYAKYLNFQVCECIFHSHYISIYCIDQRISNPDKSYLYDKFDYEFKISGVKFELTYFLSLRLLKDDEFDGLKMFFNFLELNK